MRAWPLIALLLAAPASALTPDGGATLEPSEPSSTELEEIEKALAADAPEPPQTTNSAPGAVRQLIQSLNPDLSFILDVALAAFSQDEPLQSGGHDPTRNGFNLQQLELSVGSVVDPYFRFDSNIVFSQFGVEVEEAYATTLSLPWKLQMRAGQFLTRFGRINNTHPHAWHFVDQPFAVGKVFGSEGNRGLGVEGSWLAPLPWYVEVLGSVTDAAGEATARSFYGPTDLGVSSPLDFQLTSAVKQFFALSDPLSLAFGLSWAGGPNPTGHANRSEVFGADLYLKYRPLEGADPTIVALQAEVFYRRRQVPNDVLADLQGYAYLFWRFDLRWAAAARWEYGSPAFGLDRKPGADPLDPEWSKDRHRLSANLTFWPTEFSRVRLQGSADFAAFREAPTYACFLAFEVSVGAHGAHAF